MLTYLILNLYVSCFLMVPLNNKAKKYIAINAEAALIYSISNWCGDSLKKYHKIKN